MKKLLLILFLCACSARAADGPVLPEMQLQINSQKFTVEVAASDATRTVGLMHRRIMPESRGMLFVFPYPSVQNFWMMNTYIPLSIAFIDEHGIIVNIADMKPLTTDPHPSLKPAQYALEMNQGWFAKRGIRAGAKVDGLDKVPPAQ